MPLLRPQFRPATAPVAAFARGVLFLALVVGTLLPAATVAQPAAECRFVAGFALLRDAVFAAEGVDVVGGCLEDERALDASGDTVQASTGGVFHWWRAENTTIFTGKTKTWLFDAEGFWWEPNELAGAAAHHERLGFAPGIQYLFALGAGSGAYRPLPDAPGRFVVTLAAPDANILWFSDRPQRLSGHRPLGTFLDWWNRFGFAANPPNAVLSVPGASPGQDTLVFTLDRPALSADGSLTFTGVILKDDAPRSAATQAHAAQADADLPATFGRAILFVDPGNVGGAGPWGFDIPTPVAASNSCNTSPCTFGSMGKRETWAVPAGVFRITVQAAGGRGGAASSLRSSPPTHPGGQGAQVVGTFAVRPLSVLTIQVGGRGQDITPPPPTGRVFPRAAPGGGGGGGSFVFMQSDLGRWPDTPLLAAGGGGGAALTRWEETPSRGRRAAREPATTTPWLAWVRAAKGARAARAGTRDRMAIHLKVAAAVVGAVRAGDVSQAALSVAAGKAGRAKGVGRSAGPATAGTAVVVAVAASFPTLAWAPAVAGTAEEAVAEKPVGPVAAVAATTAEPTSSST